MSITTEHLIDTIATDLRATLRRSMGEAYYREERQGEYITDMIWRVLKTKSLRKLLADSAICTLYAEAADLDGKRRNSGLETAEPMVSGVPNCHQKWLKESQVALAAIRMADGWNAKWYGQITPKKVADYAWQKRSEVDKFSPAWWQFETYYNAACDAASFE